MLAADKQALESALKQNSLAIRKQELTFFVDNFTSMAQVAALLAGFSYTGLSMNFASLDEKMMLLRAMYYFTTTLSMGFELLTVVSCTFSTMFGPGLALRGPEGSMGRAVDGMNFERNFSFVFFCAGMVAFHISGMSLAWLKFKWPEAIVVSVLLMFFLYLFWVFGRRIHSRFLIPPDALVTGQVVLGTFIPESTAGVGGGTIICGGCRSVPLLPTSKFCSSCGWKVPEKVALASCAVCRSTLPENSRFCAQCGAESGSRKGGEGSSSSSAMAGSSNMGGKDKGLPWPFKTGNE
mmetsp:Transcript_36817/g.59538  ORF Transcript_36817/g.59538 Transcript_36817/m.59538 type:complete len:294 (-) Transcript_36817:116-997(-)